MENAGKERIKIVSFRFVPTLREIENSKKIAKKFKNLTKCHYGLTSSKNKLEKDEKERK